jgi:hypothetical protein
MSSNASLYDKIVLKSPAVATPTAAKTYKGFSTISTESESFHLYDLALIRQDILNHFHVRQGERLMQPRFGTIIWDVLFEPLTEDLKQAIIRNVTDIINYDPRVNAEQVTVTTYESGIQIECRLIYQPYNISQAMQLKFDQNNGLLAQ